jgi:NADH-quinone oxidoreductase subunit G
VLLVGFEPEEESPIVFLRLRKALRDGLRVFAVAPYASRGLEKLAGTVLPAVPGNEADVLEALVTRSGLSPDAEAAVDLLTRDGAVICVGERLAAAPGGLSAAARLAAATDAKLAWIPRRAGERGAIEAGALPGLLPIGHPVADAAARQRVAQRWDVASLPDRPGRDTGSILAAAAAGKLGALLIGGVDPYDLPDPHAALAAIENTPFVVSLELRASAVTDRADVVLPVAATTQKQGTFVNWEGRGRPFGTVLEVPGILSDLQVLAAIADEMDVHLGLPDTAAARRELAELGGFRGPRPAAPVVPPPAAPAPEAGQAVLATWSLLLDKGRSQDGEPHLAGTAKPAHARLSAATAAEIGGTDGGEVTVATHRGRVTLPLVITEMPDRVIWLPTNSEGCAVRRDLVADSGALVTLSTEGGGSR